MSKLSKVFFLVSIVSFISIYSNASESLRECIASHLAQEADGFISDDQLVDITTRCSQTVTQPKSLSNLLEDGSSHNSEYCPVNTNYSD